MVPTSRAIVMAKAPGLNMVLVESIHDPGHGKVNIMAR